VNTKEAKSLAFGSKPSATLEEYYEAWQWLYDNKIELKQADIDFLDKLICDGIVKPVNDYFL
jgi:hypothetical protein